MNKISLTLPAVVCISVFLILQSCREEIIGPDNFGGSKNQPIKIRSQNSYIFLIDAHEMSSLFPDYPFIKVDKTIMSLSVIGYENGTLEINIYNPAKQLFYQRLVNRNLETIRVELDGEVPGYVEFNFSNFTGKLKFQLTRVD